MRRLILSAAIPALMLGACSTMPGAQDPTAVSVPVSQASMPNFPADLTPAGVAAADDHLALEVVDGAEAMAFVARSNERALATLEGDPRYEPFRQQAEAILTATDRVPAPSFLGDGIGNFWQDATNPKGVWRRTTLESYASGNTQWETLLDIDALARAEGRDWVFKGTSCLPPAETRCLVNLSDGGKDAVVVREFDLTTRAFVDGGFVLPEGKHRISWLDAETLLVATDFGPGTLTESGYPYIVKTLKRGQSLAQATEVYRGEAGDGGYGVSASVFRDGEGAVQAVIFNRPLDTFRSERWLWKDGTAYRLDLPQRVSLHGIQGDLLIFTIEESWRTIPAGTLLGQPIGNLTPGDPNAVIVARSGVDEIFRPGDRQSIQSVTVYDDRVVVAYNDNVVGRIATVRRSSPSAGNGRTCKSRKTRPSGSATVRAARVCSSSRPKAS